jgi:hypothetical protein
VVSADSTGEAQFPANLGYSLVRAAYGFPYLGVAQAGILQHFPDIGLERHPSPYKFSFFDSHG